MLSVRIDGREVETTPVSLARLVLDGTVDRHSPSRVPGTAAERSLEQSLETPHCQALSDELLRRLRSMCASESPAVDVHELCERVEHLCQWRWTSPHVAARFLWAAAWLNDVMDRLENAVEFYDAFLQTASREGHLRLLAYNNRGVLRIRLGRLEGVQDLARAVVPDGAGEKQDDPSDTRSATANPRLQGLPAACFNLLNLINVSLETRDLAQVVDEELSDFFSQIPEQARTFWIGEAIPGDGHEQGIWPGRGEEPRSGLAIVCDPTHRRLNALTTRLAARARELAGGESSAMGGRSSTGASPLVLWESRLEGDGRLGNISGLERGYAHCAAAASLLLSEDIPGSLSRTESPVARAEQAAWEELASVENCLALGQYELARSRLQVQHRILSSLNRRGRLAGLLARVDAQLERVASLESQKRQLDLQRVCAGLISRVEQFCRLTDPSRAQGEYDDLVARLRHVQSGLGPQTSAEVTALLDELAVRLDRHLARLKRLEIRRRIRDPQRHLRANWPTDEALPVPQSVYQALAQCHLNDPQCRVENWTALLGQLDAHQGRYHVRKALTTVQAGQAAWEQVRDDLAKALLLQPASWKVMGPLFGLQCPSQAGDSCADGPGIALAIHASASRLFDGGSDGEGASNAAGTDDLMRRAAELLGHTFQQMNGRTHAARCIQLWESVADTLSPLLTGDSPDAAARVRDLAETCLDHWPAAMADLPGRADPRNPVNLTLESCETARRLAEAGQRLHARPPRWEEARQCYSEILALGLEMRDQLRRAVTEFYLAAFHEQDAPHVQRQVLAGLEAWVNGMPHKSGRQVTEQEVVREIGRLRAAVSADRSAPVAESPRPDGPATGIERALMAGDSGSGLNDSMGGGHDPQEEGKSEV